MSSCGVCPSVCHVLDHVKTNKHIFAFFSPSGSHIILVFLYQTVWQYSDGTFERGHKMQGHEKVSIFGQYLALSRKWYKTESYLQEFKLDWIAKTWRWDGQTTDGLTSANNAYQALRGAAIKPKNCRYAINAHYVPISYIVDCLLLR